MAQVNEQPLERPITFNYSYRMRGESCGNSSTLTPAEHQRLNKQAGARMPCEHCSAQIHIGPLIADIRDPDDPALDDGMVNRLAWYHSGTYATWPSEEYIRDLKAAFANTRVRGLLKDPGRYLDTQLNKALHVGTYEAAIETMYRRMRNQADATSSFFLHRVTLDVDAGRINAGFVDENDEPAGWMALGRRESPKGRGLGNGETACLTANNHDVLEVRRPRPTRRGCCDRRSPA